jgi:hypothetical protein
MTPAEFIADAQKAVACAGSFAGLAIGLGLCDDATAGYVTTGIGALATTLVYLARNVKPAVHPDSGTHTEGS